MLCSAFTRYAIFCGHISWLYGAVSSKSELSWSWKGWKERSFFLRACMIVQVTGNLPLTFFTLLTLQYLQHCRTNEKPQFPFFCEQNVLQEQHTANLSGAFWNMYLTSEKCLAKLIDAVLINYFMICLAAVLTFLRKYWKNCQKHLGDYAIISQILL